MAICINSFTLARMCDTIYVLMLDRVKINALEVRLSVTAAELDKIILEYFPRQPLADIGDTAEVVRLLHLQAWLVEQLGIEKAKLREKKK